MIVATIHPKAMATRSRKPLPAPELGLVCLTTTDEVRYRTITRKTLSGLDEAGGDRALLSVYRDNVERLRRAIRFCEANRIRLYRVPSGLLPFSDTERGQKLLDPIREDLLQIGNDARTLGIRLVLHPDQFAVLNSDSERVIDNSIVFLKSQALLMDLLGQPLTPWATIEIHGGKSDRAAKLVETIARLPENIRCRLALENDERGYSATEILGICHQAGVPMVFDAHHHVVHEKLSSYDHPSVYEMVRAARGTWPDPSWQMVHISNGREGFCDPAHHDFITTMPEAYREVPWIEVEAKLKEQAIRALRDKWLRVA